MSAALELKKILDRWLGIPLVTAAAALDRFVVGPPDRAAGEAGCDRILFIKLWGVGNLAMILPIVRAARRQHPRASIEFLTLPENAEFVTAAGQVDRVWTFSPRGVGTPFLRLVRLALALRRRRFDRIVDFEQFLRATALVTRVARPARSAGFDTPRQARAPLYSDRVEHDERRHMALGFRDLARRAGVEVRDVPLLEVPRSPAAARRIAPIVTRLRSTARPVVAVHVGSGDNFPGRRWPIRAFAEFADRVHRANGATIAFTGTRAERALVAACRGAMRGPSVDLSGEFTLVEFVEFLARVDLVVSNDSAPVHVAAALDVPQVALYGPNTPTRYGPLSSRARTFHSGLACSPCITNKNAKTSACHRPLCLHSIVPDAVAAAALAMLDRHANSQVGAPPSVRRAEFAP